MSTLPPVEIPSPSPTGAVDAGKAAKSALSGFIVLMGCASAAGFWILCQAPTLVLIGIESLLLWGCVVTLIQYFYLTFPGGRFSSLWQWLLLACAVIAVVKCLLRRLMFLGRQVRRRWLLSGFRRSFFWPPVASSIFTQATLTPSRRG